MLRGYLPIGLKGRLPLTEPESWRMGDAPYMFIIFLGLSKKKAKTISDHCMGPLSASRKARYWSIIINFLVP